MPPIQVVVAVNSDAYRIALCDFLGHLSQITVVAAAQNRVEALRLVSEIHPDLLILDIHVPQMEGWEVMRQLQKSESAVRILAIALHAAAQTEQQALDSGACAYVCRDDVALLVDTLHQLLIEERK